MPVHMDFQLLQALQRKRMQPVVEAGIERLRVMLRYGQQHVGFTHHLARGEIMLAAKNDPALSARAIQLRIHQAWSQPARGNQDMVLPEIGVEIEFTPYCRMVLAAITTTRSENSGAWRKLS